MTAPVTTKTVLNFSDVSSMEQVAQSNPNLKGYATTAEDDYQAVKKDPTNSAAICKYVTDVATLAAHEGIDPDPNGSQMQELENGIASALQAAVVSQETLSTAFPSAAFGHIDRHRRLRYACLSRTTELF